LLGDKKADELLQHKETARSLATTWPKDSKKSGRNPQANYLGSECSVFGAWNQRLGRCFSASIQGAWRLQHCTLCFFPNWVAFIFRKVLLRKPFYLHHAKEGKINRKTEHRETLQIP
jgi:hypothetical protein